jgi:hypothetical protein
MVLKFNCYLIFHVQFVWVTSVMNASVMTATYKDKFSFLIKSGRWSQRTVYPVLLCWESVLGVVLNIYDISRVGTVLVFR